MSPVIFCKQVVTCSRSKVSVRYVTGEIKGGGPVTYLPLNTLAPNNQSVVSNCLRTGEFEQVVNTG